MKMISLPFQKKLIHLQQCPSSGVTWPLEFKFCWWAVRKFSRWDDGSGITCKCEQGGCGAEGPGQDLGSCPWLTAFGQPWLTDRFCSFHTNLALMVLILILLSTFWSGEIETSLAVQWLSLWAANAGDMGLIPAQRTKTPHVAKKNVFDLKIKLYLKKRKFQVKINVSGFLSNFCKYLAKMSLKAQKRAMS